MTDTDWRAGPDGRTPQPGRLSGAPGASPPAGTGVPGTSAAGPGAPGGAIPGPGAPGPGAPGGSAPGGTVATTGDPSKGGTRGYVDTAAVSGTSLGEKAYWGALLLAAGADIAAFHQIISLVMRRQDDWLIWLMVVGFTTAALTLAHFGGRLARDVTAGRAPATRNQVALCLVPWAALGLVAFAVRLVVADETSVTTVDGTALGLANTFNGQLASALMFLGLYVASGAVAGFGAYLTRNPVGVGYRRAMREHHRALAHLARTRPPYERAVQVYRQHIATRQREEENWQAARQQRLSQSDELKRYAAVLIATRLKDPSATDAMTLPDRRPLQGPPDNDGDHAAGAARPRLPHQKGT